jgi:hypothetical protein
MKDSQATEQSPPQRDKSNAGTDVPSASAAKPASDISAQGESGSQKKLTAEEQMALYENDLKENDWGHQPC